MNELKLAIAHAQAVLIRLRNGEILLGWPVMDPETESFGLYDGSRKHNIVCDELLTVSRIIA
ncbi:hypothetical protein Q5741_02640 [Paenibacillus sp. JX-17]|uniref:Uncharacterized protein n=1 Tax=Paenibacillus lacisoli TaxID=3064525 RepID=A0ABT9C7V3_9BACL|nr:hypothetical protein [Paenibacillus sp. JX-17]MDO7905310.1 hypothetical protein [Paenibacillus sp. JX-17]